MIKVTKHVVRRELTDVSEFQRQKSSEPWKSKRQDAKAVGVSLPLLRWGEGYMTYKAFCVFLVALVES